ncbi:VC0807 family protein [Dictyobacter kobayashii]|uniref:Intracellular septation protein A n=1 Tax=Dictyobacter kobayashii TaxID=2014872 RepID=A0A402AV31_9CHLR|nr:VC0807 family protein [Dictyobacter kobayashii]GCE22919.1 hypothetical protein KDK_67190 [Dictyobacter kobayashii]
MSTNTLPLTQVIEKQQNVPSQKSMLLKMLPGMLINTGAPFLIYSLASSHMSTVNALLLASAVPLVMTTVELIRKRRVDMMGVLIVLGFVLTAATAYIFNSPKLLLLQSTVVSGLFGLIFLISLLFQKPLLFYVMRSLRCHNDARLIANFNADWEYPQARTFYRVLTSFWGFLMVAHVALQVLFVMTLSVATVVALGSILNVAIIGGGAAFSLYYAYKNRSALQKIKQQRGQ